MLVDSSFHLSSLGPVSVLTGAAPGTVVCWHWWLLRAHPMHSGWKLNLAFSWSWIGGRGDGALSCWQAGPEPYDTATSTKPVAVKIVKIRCCLETITAKLVHDLSLTPFVPMVPLVWYSSQIFVYVKPKCRFFLAEVTKAVILKPLTRCLCPVLWSSSHDHSFAELCTDIISLRSDRSWDRCLLTICIQLHVEEMEPPNTHKASSLAIHSLFTVPEIKAVLPDLSLRL